MLKDSIFENESIRNLRGTNDRGLNTKSFQRTEVLKDSHAETLAKLVTMLTVKCGRRVYMHVRIRRSGLE